MRLTTTTDALTGPISQLTRVVERRNTIPVLGNIRMVLMDEALVLTSTDLDIEMRIRIDAAGGAEGSLTVSARMLDDVLRKLPKGATLTLDGSSEGTLRIISGRARFTLQTLPAQDFPDIAAGEMPHGFNLPATDLLALLKQPQFAISTEETRYYLNGVFLHVPEGSTNLVAVATDGHRLARVLIPAPENALGMPGVIIPRKTVGEVVRLAEEIAKSNGALFIKVSAQKIVFQTDTTRLTSKLIDGTFPDYTRVIPAANSRPATAGRAGMLAAVDRVSTIATERGRDVKLAFAGDALTFSVTNPEAGTSEDVMEIAYAAAAMEIGFNGKYLQDVLGAFDGESVQIALEDAGSPTLFTAPENDRLLVVLMPMRV